jgi:hypothetical protein
MGKAKNPIAGTNPQTEDMVWKPSEDRLREIFSEEVAKVDSGSVGLSNVCLHEIAKPKIRLHVLTRCVSV